jgi:hypothetical protein
MSIALPTTILENWKEGAKKFEGAQAVHRNQDNASAQINDLMELISRCGAVATVVGDPKQSRPISPINSAYSAIEWVMKRSKWDTLRISHRLPDRLSGLVNEFANTEV